jgi:hypothetical protein
LVVVDRKMIEFYANEVHDYVLTQLFIASEIYKHPSLSRPIQVIVSDIVYLNDTSNKPNITWDAEKTLDNFCVWQYQYRQKSMLEFDVALLLTKYIKINPLLNENLFEKNILFEEKIYVKQKITVPHLVWLV